MVIVIDIDCKFYEVLCRNECLNCLIGEPEVVPLRFIRKGLYEISTNSRVRLPYNHGKKSWDKFVLLTLF